METRLKPNNEMVLKMKEKAYEVTRELSKIQENWNTSKKRILELE